MVMACAMAFGISGISHDFAPIFWGKGFSECGILLALLAIYLPVQGFASVLRTQYLIPNRWDKQYTISLCIGAIVNVVINYLLIPQFHAVGAVIGTIAAETSVCVAQALFVSKCLPIKTYIMQSIPFICIGAIMFGVIRGIEVFMHTSIATLYGSNSYWCDSICGIELGYVIVTKHELYDIWKRENTEKKDIK